MFEWLTDILICLRWTGILSNLVEQRVKVVGSASMLAVPMRARDQESHVGCEKPFIQVGVELPHEGQEPIGLHTRLETITEREDPDRIEGKSGPQLSVDFLWLI